MSFKFMVLGKSDGSTMIVDAKRARLWHLRRRIFAWSKAVDKIACAPGVRKAMFRLSYDTEGTLVPASNWAPLHISEFIDGLHARMGKRLLAYAWVAEVQRRGVIHYHVLLIFTGSAPVPDKEYRGRDARGHMRNFKRLWPYGLSHCTWNVRTHFYLSSYVKKEYQKDFDKFPMGAHAWGVYVQGDKYALRFFTASDRMQAMVLVTQTECGCSLEEAWWHVKYEINHELWLARRAGVERWCYLGSINSAADVKEWGITDDQLQGHTFTHFKRPI